MQKSNPYDFGIIGNMRTNALIDTHGKIVWWCFPEPDDPAICCALLDNHTQAEAGFIGVDFPHIRKINQFYERNTPILITRLSDNAHNVIEIVDFAPCYIYHERLYTPPQIMRIIRRVAGRPRISLQVRPVADNGNAQTKTIVGANHVSYFSPGQTLRITTDAAISDLLEESSFYLTDTITLIMGEDEAPPQAPHVVGEQAYLATRHYWQTWVHNISIPFEWQSAVIRAAITLRLNTFADTGAILSAPTTSLPDNIQNANYTDCRYSWLRDCEQVIHALNAIGATGTMERYLSYILNIIADAERTSLQPVYGIRRQSNLCAHLASALSGYQGQGPVYLGNDAYQEVRNDVYGCVVSACTQAFFDERLYAPATLETFEQLGWLAQAAFDNYDQPDADVWHRKDSAGIHTLSSVMCWTACQRLSIIATALSLNDEASEWQNKAQTIREAVLTHAWNEELQTLTSLWDGDTVDASLLLIVNTGFLSPNDTIWKKTLSRIEQCLLRDHFLLRFEGEDSTAVTSVALRCTFWWIKALVADGQIARARSHFEYVLSCCNHLGLLASHISTDDSHAPLGNFPQTSSMVGILDCAMLLSKPWNKQFTANPNA